MSVLKGRTEEQGKETYSVLENYARKYLNLRKIKAFVVSAIHMYEKLGFRKSGELIAERYINGEYHLVLLFENMIKSVWGGDQILKLLFSDSGAILYGRPCIGGCIE